MTAKKLDFLITNGGQKSPVKARLFRGIDGATYASIHGDLFNDCEISMNRLDQLIDLLLEVRAASSNLEECDAGTA